jgi:hypothetical protein
MKLSLIRVLALALMMGMGTSALAASDHPDWEIGASSSGGLSFLTGSGSITGSNSFNLTGSASYTLGSGFQVFASPAFTELFGKNVNSVTVLNLIVGPAYSFGATRLQDSFGVAAGIGFSLFSSSGSSQTNFVYKFSVVKRFGLTDSISYVPGLSYQAMTGSNGEGTAGEFDVTLLGFSFFF